jgi:hypothetical protein
MATSSSYESMLKAYEQKKHYLNKQQNPSSSVRDNSFSRTQGSTPTSGLFHNQTQIRPQV